MPDREFFSVAATLGALLWVSLLVESHLHPEAFLLERIKAVGERVRRLEVQRDALRATAASVAELQRRVGALTDVDRAMAEHLERVEQQRRSVSDALELTRQQISDNIGRRFAIFDGSRPAAEAATGDDESPDTTAAAPESSAGGGGGSEATDRGFVGLQARTLSLLGRAGDFEIDAQFLAQNRSLVANQTTALYTELAGHQQTLAERTKELEVEQWRLGRLRGLRVRLYRWLPPLVSLAGGWTEATALTALYGRPTPLGAVLVISGLAMLATIFAGVLAIRLFATEENTPVGPVERWLSRMVVLILLVTPLALATIYTSAILR
ncbi:hypothetical protein AB0J90_13505 [Micromonospora sp. NPDC049523]|uniref:hypothetical protein n=1 Tax=Micromonospora sp. NPDC049523 TaxID=3155921 RepID=UPI00343ED6A8